MELNLGTLDALVLLRVDGIDDEVWGILAQGEPKEFRSTPPTGLIKPTPVRSVPQNPWDYQEPYRQNVATSNLTSAFCPVTGATRHDASELQTASPDVQKLIKSMKITERQLNFQLLQRAQMYEREHELSRDRMVLADKVQDLTEYVESLEQKNSDLKTRFRQVTEENKSLSTQVDRLVNYLEVVAAEELRLQRGEGEGVKLGGLAESVEILQDTEFDQLDSWTDLSPCDSVVNVNESANEEISARFHSPASNGAGSEVRLITEDTPPVGSSKQKTKKSHIPRSLFGRLSGAFGRIRGQIRPERSELKDGN
ncbi:uncharacterized protein LOC124266284 [Haliotis rubra]|uniref:uncharacterized protein LOC124266284 n=1 Tax=Haliotis rubra TaxID=36100 RepID=UPI001EE5AAA9|nr:uncharacterized protein LOC124266284 [Haliotis rubra]